MKFGMIHPQLCEEDGDRFLADLLRARRPLVIAGCAPNMQFKLFRDAFAAQGMDVKKDMVPLDIRDMTTDAAVAKVRTALHEMGFDEDGTDVLGGFTLPEIEEDLNYIFTEGTLLPAFTGKKGRLQ